MAEGMTGGAVAQTTLAQPQQDVVVALRPRSRLAVIAWEIGAILLLCAIAAALRLWPLNGASVDSQDEGVYWQSLRALSAGQPLFKAIFSSQPPLFLLGLLPFYQTFGHTLGAARFGVVVYSLVGLLALYAAARLIGGRWAGLGACALLIGDPLYLAESHVLHAEVPSLAYALAAVALAAACLRCRWRWQPIFALSGGALAGLGVMVKLFDVAVLVPLALYLTVPFWAAISGQAGRGRWTWLRGLGLTLLDLLLMVAGAAGAVAAVLLPFRPVWPALYDQVITFHQVAERTFLNFGPQYNLHLIDMNEQVYPLYLLALFACALAIWRRAWALLPPVLWLAVSFALLVRQQPMFGHHIVMLSAPLALIAGPALALALRDRAVPAYWGRVERRSILAGVALGMSAVLLYGGFRTAINANSTYSTIDPADLAMARALHNATRPHELVVTDNQYVAGLADRTVVPQLVDTSQVRIATAFVKGQPRTNASISAETIKRLIIHDRVRVILFASGRFNPDVIDGFQWWVNQYYKPIAQFGSGRVLYAGIPPRAEPAPRPHARPGSTS